MNASSPRDKLARRAAQSQGRWDWRGTGRLLRRAHAVAAISQWTKDDTLKRCPEAAAAEIVYYGASALSEPAISVSAPGPYLFCAARAAEYKGLDILLMAFAGLAQKRPELHLIICGEDLSSGGLERFAEALGLSGRVHCLGLRSNAEVRAWMRGCMFFVMPSRRESLGIAAIEALQAGKAVVAARVGGLPEIVRDGVDGMLVEPKSVPGLAEALERLAGDDVLRERMGSAGRDRSREFGWDKAMARYMEIYRGHPAMRAGKPGAAAALLIWDRAQDASARAYRDNAAKEFAAGSWPAVLCLRRSAWTEAFRTDASGIAVYHLGLGAHAPRLIDALTALVQLFWISKKESVGVWHFLLLRYRDLWPLRAFAAASGIRPVVTLS